MRFFHNLYTYDFPDESKFTSLEKDLVHNIRRETEKVYLKTCQEFYIAPVPIPVYFYEGEIQGRDGEISLVSAGNARTGDVAGEFFGELYYSLPYALAFPKWTLDDTVPHEVAHIIANQIFGKQCAHGKEWEEVMKYLNIPIMENFILKPEENEILRNNMKFSNYALGVEWSGHRAK